MNKKQYSTYKNLRVKSAKAFFAPGMVFDSVSKAMPFYNEQMRSGYDATGNKTMDWMVDSILKRVAKDPNIQSAEDAVSAVGIDPNTEDGRQLLRGLALKVGDDNDPGNAASFRDRVQQYNDGDGFGMDDDTSSLSVTPNGVSPTNPYINSSGTPIEDTSRGLADSTPASYGVASSSTPPSTDSGNTPDSTPSDISDPFYGGPVDSTTLSQFDGVTSYANQNNGAQVNNGGVIEGNNWSYDGSDQQQPEQANNGSEIEDYASPDMQASIQNFDVNKSNAGHAANTQQQPVQQPAQPQSQPAQPQPSQPRGPGEYKDLGELPPLPLTRPSYDITTTGAETAWHDPQAAKNMERADQQRKEREQQAAEQMRNAPWHNPLDEEHKQQVARRSPTTRRKSEIINGTYDTNTLEGRQGLANAQAEWQKTYDATAQNLLRVHGDAWRSRGFTPDQINNYVHNEVMKSMQRRGIDRYPGQQPQEPVINSAPKTMLNGGQWRVG